MKTTADTPALNFTQFINKNIGDGVGLSSARVSLVFPSNSKSLFAAADCCLKRENGPEELHRHPAGQAGGES